MDEPLNSPGPFDLKMYFDEKGKNSMFVIISADGTVRKVFKGTDPSTVVELACQLQCEGDQDYSLRLAEARRLLQEDTTWTS